MALGLGAAGEILLQLGLFGHDLGVAFQTGLMLEAGLGVDHIEETLFALLGGQIVMTARSGALLEVFIHPIPVKGRAGEQVVEIVGEGAAGFTLHPAAGVHRPVGKNGHVAVAAVAAAVNDAVVRIFRDFKKPLFSVFYTITRLFF